MIDSGFFWATSQDAERWDGPHETAEEAFEEACSENNGYDPGFWIAPGTWMDPANCIDVDRIINELGEDDWENSPYEESWCSYWDAEATKPDALKKLEAKLQAAFREWDSEMKLRRWYRVDCLKAVYRPCPESPKPCTGEE